MTTARVENGPPIFEHEGEWGRSLARMTAEPGCNRGNGEIGSELLGLGETAPREFLAGDPGGKAEVVLDACAGARLTPEASSVDDENRQALRRRIDRGGKPSRAGAHHGDVIATFPDRVRQDVQVPRQGDVPRVLENRSAGAD